MTSRGSLGSEGWLWAAVSAVVVVVLVLSITRKNRKKQQQARPCSGQGEPPGTTSPDS